MILGKDFHLYAPWQKLAIIITFTDSRMTFEKENQNRALCDLRE